MDYPTALSQYGSEIELHADKTPVLPDIIRKGHVMFLQTSLARKKIRFHHCTKDARSFVRVPSHQVDFKQSKICSVADGARFAQIEE